MQTKKSNQKTCLSTTLSGTHCLVLQSNWSAVLNTSNLELQVSQQAVPEFRSCADDRRGNCSKLELLTEKPSAFQNSVTEAHHELVASR